MVFGPTAPSASRTSPTTPPSSRSCARRSRCPRPRSPPSATSSPRSSRCSPRGHDVRLGAHLRRASPAPPTRRARPRSSSSATARAASACAWWTPPPPAGGSGLVVLAAVGAAEAGEDLDGGGATRRGGARRTSRSGSRSTRSSSSSAAGGSARPAPGSARRCEVKPILTVESELTPVERVRTSSRAFERLVDYARQRHESGADAWVVQHISAQEQADALVERCREIFGCEPVFVSEIGPVISAARRAGPARRGLHPRAPPALSRGPRAVRRPPQNPGAMAAHETPRRARGRADRPDRRLRRRRPVPHLPAAQADRLAARSPRSWRSRCRARSTSSTAT